jgi:hypothetical protein
MHSVLILTIVTLMGATGGPLPMHGFAIIAEYELT